MPHVDVAHKADVIKTDRGYGPVGIAIDPLCTLEFRRGPTVGFSLFGFIVEIDGPKTFCLVS